MPLIPDSLLQAERNHGFDLRGKPAKYRHTVETLNPKTGIIARDNTDTPIVVITGPRSSTASVNRVFRVRTCELPDRAARNGDRVVYCGEEYVITSWLTDQSDLVMDLTTRVP